MLEPTSKHQVGRAQQLPQHLDNRQHCSTGFTGSASNTGTVSKYGQCGGTCYTGATTCASGSTCTKLNDYHSQCL